MRRVLVVVVIIAAVIWAARTLTSKREIGGGSAVTRDGSTVEVAALPDAPMTIVHFWGTWCGPCRHELPDYAAFKREYEPRGVGFVTIADDPDFATVDRYLRDAGIAIEPMLLDARGATARSWGVRVYPTTFVIGPTNDILAMYRGTIDWTSPLQRREILRLGGMEP